MSAGEQTILVTGGAGFVGSNLADRLATMEDRAEKAERHLNRLQSNPVRVEVPTIPSDLKEAMAELAARAESLADRMEEQGAR